MKYTPSAIKDVGGFFGSQLFAHGVGEIGGSAEVNVAIELLFAMVDSLEIGTRMDSMYQVTVGSEGLPAGTTVADRAVVQVYPNPGSAIGQIQIDLREAGHASVCVFDLLGRVVSVPLTESFLTAGRSVHLLDAHDLAPGLYFVTLALEGIVVSTTRYILIR